MVQGFQSSSPAGCNKLAERASAALAANRGSRWGEFMDKLPQQLTPNQVCLDLSATEINGLEFFK